MRFGTLTRGIAERYLSGDELLLWLAPQPLSGRCAVLERSGAAREALMELCTRWEQWRPGHGDEETRDGATACDAADEAWHTAWTSAEESDRLEGRRYDSARYAEQARVARRSVLLAWARQQA